MIERLIEIFFALLALAGIAAIVIFPAAFFYDFKGPRTSDACRVAAVEWVGAEAGVRSCTVGGCDVVTTAGCEIRLDCRGSTDPADDNPVYVRRSGDTVRCPGTTTERVVYQ